MQGLTELKVGPFNTRNHSLALPSTDTTGLSLPAINLKSKSTLEHGSPRFNDRQYSVPAFGTVNTNLHPRCRSLLAVANEDLVRSILNRDEGEQKLASDLPSSPNFVGCVMASEQDDTQSVGVASDRQFNEVNKLFSKHYRVNDDLVNDQMIKLQKAKELIRKNPSMLKKNIFLDDKKDNFDADPKKKTGPDPYGEFAVRVLQESYRDPLLKSCLRSHKEEAASSALSLK